MFEIDISTVFLILTIIGVLAAAYYFSLLESSDDEKSKEEQTEELIQKLIRESNTGDLFEIQTKRLDWESMVEDRMSQVDPDGYSAILNMYKYLVRKEEWKKIHDDLIRESAGGNPLGTGNITLKVVASWVVDETSYLKNVVD